MISTVIFDLDQTLVDRQATMARFLTIQHAKFERHLNTPTDTFVETILRHQKNGYADKHDAYQQACAELGEDVSLAKVLLDDLQTYYGHDAVLFDRVPETLATLSKTYTLACITNGRTVGQTAKLESSGIKPWFAVIKISEAVGVKKPDHRIFQACLDALNVDASVCVYIGDNPTNDITPAKELGMKAIWMRNAFYTSPDDCDGIVDKISEIPALLTQL
ncbi:MAG: HAD family hydrolase [Chloroflexota bacterium]